MAERSKAPVSGTGLFGGVGSNPTPIIFLPSTGTKIAGDNKTALPKAFLEVGCKTGLRTRSQTVGREVVPKNNFEIHVRISNSFSTQIIKRKLTCITITVDDVPSNIFEYLLFFIQNFGFI